MRIRNIKPNFYRSDDIDALTWEQRFMFVALWSYVDDNGVGRDKLSDICADLFAADLSVEPTETLRRVSLALEALEERGLIARYEAEGRPYLYVTSWDRHQLVKNPGNPRYPRPDKGLPQTGESLPTSSVDSTENLLPVVKEQGNRGTGEQGVSPNGDEPPEVEELCELLADLIVHNGSKRPKVTSTWRTECRLMLERDGRTPEQIRSAIIWSQNDTFWRANVLSMPKLREKYDQLRLQAECRTNGRPRPDVLDRAEQRFQAKGAIVR